MNPVPQDLQPYNSKLIEILEKTVQNLAVFDMDNSRESLLLSALKNQSISLYQLAGVQQPATEPLILANLTKHEFERLSHGRIPYSGAAGDPHYDKDPRPWGKHAPYIATYLGELIPAVKAMKWTHFSVKHEHGQWLAIRDLQPATESDAFYKQYSEQDVPHGAMPPCRHFFRNSMSSEPGDYVCKSCGAIGVEISPDQQRALALRDVLQGQWISVKERLPEMDATEYLVCRSGYTAPGLGFKNGLEIEAASGQAFWYNFRARGFGITHWQPLPASPAARQVPVGPAKEEK